jgi:hypothetical protein
MVPASNAVGPNSHRNNHTEQTHQDLPRMERLNLSAGRYTRSVPHETAHYDYKKQHFRTKRASKKKKLQKKCKNAFPQYQAAQARQQKCDSLRNHRGRTIILTRGDKLKAIPFF